MLCKFTYLLTDCHNFAEYGFFHIVFLIYDVGIHISMCDFCGNCSCLLLLQILYLNARLLHTCNLRCSLKKQLRLCNHSTSSLDFQVQFQRWNCCWKHMKHLDKLFWSCSSSHRMRLNRSLQGYSSRWRFLIWYTSFNGIVCPYLYFNCASLNLQTWKKFRNVKRQGHCFRNWWNFGYIMGHKGPIFKA